MFFDTTNEMVEAVIPTLKKVYAIGAAPPNIEHESMEDLAYELLNNLIPVIEEAIEESQEADRINAKEKNL